MLTIFWNSRSSMTANQEKMDAISNNIANSETDGYKRETVSFKDLVYDTFKKNGYAVTDNTTRGQDPFTGTGVRAADWIRDNTQGPLQVTNQATDLAIDGPGYFRLTDTNGNKVYSRAGKFEIDGNGQLVDSKGNRLDIQYNAGVDPKTVQFTKDNFTISSDGNITVKENGNYVNVGKISLYQSQGSEAFASIGDNLYQPVNGAAVTTVTGSDIRQNMLEGSNVDMGQEMTDMIVTQRAYELGSKGIKVADDMWNLANNLRGK
ncbi:flagellar basal body rod protein FlgG [Clostridium sp. 19966]|uniref:flagellar hook-basal body complex protein n=1 Tax=Clostridium sp. 19966 TaxID=2768166 RepID=UPI0028DDCDB1|nr:flagellar hook-basal body complex protein [Clostridium sp. 19966]MDT8716635.1 flagellar basal body rod protein FlgG [Clostridium sp. 19966]